jgi:hypothetical protein
LPLLAEVTIRSSGIFIGFITKSANGLLIPESPGTALNRDGRVLLL